MRQVCFIEREHASGWAAQPPWRRRRLRSSARPAGFNNPDVSYDPHSPGTTPTVASASDGGPVL